MTDQRHDSLARRFADALEQIEQGADVEVLVDLFAEDAELRSLLHDEPLRGRAGAEQFWREYQAAFREAHSRFEHIRDVDGLAVLEWVTDATLASGAPVVYSGVSLVEHDGQHVHRFRTYYDSRALDSLRARDHEPARSFGKHPT